LGEYFIDAEKARSFRGDLNRFIENSLKQSHFVPRCKACGKPLPPQSEFSICQSCFNKLNRAKQGIRTQEKRLSPHSGVPPKKSRR
jgi:ATP-dependent RNA helicase SUPV3L1/SUV3